MFEDSTKIQADPDNITLPPAEVACTTPEHGPLISLSDIVAADRELSEGMTFAIFRYIYEKGNYQSADTVENVVNELHQTLIECFNQEVIDRFCRYAAGFVSDICRLSEKLPEVEIIESFFDCGDHIWDHRWNYDPIADLYYDALEYGGLISIKPEDMDALGYITDDRTQQYQNSSGLFQGSFLLDDGEHALHMLFPDFTPEFEDLSMLETIKMMIKTESVPVGHCENPLDL